MAELLYLKLSESCLAEKRKVKIKDVATVLLHLETSIPTAVKEFERIKVLPHLIS